MINIPKKTIIMSSIFMGSALMSSAVCALEKLSDSSLSEQTAQDGVTIKFQNDGTIGLDKVRLIQNGNDFSSEGTDFATHKNSAGIEIDLQGSEKVRFCQGQTASATCTTANDPTTIVIDTDGGSGDPFINASVLMSSQSIYVPKTQINLIGTAQTGQPDRNTTWVTTPLLEFTDGIKINSKGKSVLNLQLGAQPQGSMVVANLVETDIDFGEIKLFSNGTNPSSITTNVAINGFNGDLTDGSGTTIATASETKIDIDGTKGLVVQKDRATIKSINIDNTVLGGLGSSDPNIFNGLQNASIGDISIQDIQINDLQISISGM